jgi:hypothetical protein
MGLFYRVSKKVTLEIVTQKKWPKNYKICIFWWTNDLFCLLCVGCCERKLWKCHFRPSRDSKVSKFSQCSAFISAQLPFTTKNSPRKNYTLQSGPYCHNFNSWVLYSSHGCVNVIRLSHEGQPPPFLRYCLPLWKILDKSNNVKSDF